MTVCDDRKSSPNSPTSNQAMNATNADPMVKVGSPIDSRSAICSDTSRDPLRERPANTSSVASPVMAMASETLSPAALHNSRNSAKRPRLSWTAGPNPTVAHGMVRGAMRIDSWSGVVGSASAMRRARSQLSRAAAMSRLVDHAPARLCQPYAARSSPAACRCSAISAAFSSTDPGSHSWIAAARRRCHWARSDFSCDS